MSALRIANHPKLLGIGARHITVSTCGIIEGIRKFAQEPEQFTLAISLHSAIQNKRDRIMPKVANQRLDTLKATLKDYTTITGRRITFEYAMMNSINDSKQDLSALIDYCNGLLCHINLIPINQVEGSEFKPSPSSTIEQWLNELNSAGIDTNIRNSRGDDIQAACGQLASTHL